MAIELVNGHGGSAHVSGADVGRLYAAVFGEGSYAIGGEASFSMSDANTLSLAACDLMVDGMHVTLDGTDAWKVDSGATGRKRRDLACLRYAMDADTGVETVEAAVLKGEATTGAAADPDVPSGSRSGGSSEAWYPVARVTLDGLTPAAESLLAPSKTLEELAAEVKSASDNADYVKAQLGTKAPAGALTSLTARVKNAEAKLAKITCGSFVKNVSGDHIDITASDVGYSGDPHKDGACLMVSNGDYLAVNMDLDAPRWHKSLRCWVVLFRSVTNGNPVAVSGPVRVNWALVRN